MNDVREKLVEWYKSMKRDLPWRRTREPYFIWVSEIIFQQTRIDQGLNYYLEFVKKFPNIEALASASEDEVLKTWQGLGYYSRARNMHFSAKYIVDELGAKFPTTYEEIIKLKGVGPYTAAAIASISFNLPYPVIDGNVQRFISRLFAIHEAVNTSIGMKSIASHIEKVFDIEQPGDFNQAMMEYGAVVCKPKNPCCDDCIFIQDCKAYKENITGNLPIKNKAKKAKNVYLYYYVFKLIRENKTYFFFRKRANDGIWRGLYDFLSIESDQKIERKSILTHASLDGILNSNKLEVKSVSDYYSHQLSHLNIKACFIEILINDGFEHEIFKSLIKVELSQINTLPISKLISNYLLNKEIAS